ncbi:MAG TPA: hypothetical protein VGG61_14640 [Gemmataceae bacterium]
MEPKQSRISDIIESERLMALSAPERFGYFHDNAMGTNYLLQNGIVGVPYHRSLFARWGSQLKKYHLLAVFSFVRLHQVQGLMNLRQVLEAAVDAAFAVAHPDDINDYGYTDKHGAIMTPQSFKKKRYALAGRELQRRVRQPPVIEGRHQPIRLPCLGRADDE